MDGDARRPWRECERKMRDREARRRTGRDARMGGHGEARHRAKAEAIREHKGRSQTPPPLTLGPLTTEDGEITRKIEARPLPAIARRTQPAMQPSTACYGHETLHLHTTAPLTTRPQIIHQRISEGKCQGESSRERETEGGHLKRRSSVKT